LSNYLTPQSFYSSQTRAYLQLWWF